ncbi:MAG: hypothetical protein ACP5MT_02610 [Candidatus Acidifodinimicrobium sp.]
MIAGIYSQVINTSFLNPFSYFATTVLAFLLSIVLLAVMIIFIRNFQKRPDLLVARIRLYKNIWIMFLFIMLIDVFLILDVVYVQFFNPLMLIYTFWSLGYISLGSIVAYILAMWFMLYVMGRKIKTK